MDRILSYSPTMSKENFDILLEMKVQSHRHRFLWDVNSQVDPRFVNMLFEYLSQYNSIPTRLAEISCWFIHKVLSKDTLSIISDNIRTHDILDSFLRIGLLTSSHSSCFFVLNAVCECDYCIFGDLCRRGLKIVEKFENSLKAVNYYDLLLFIIHNIERWFIHFDIVLLAMEFLAEITKFVESDVKSNFFFQLITPTILKYFSINSLQDQLRSITVTVIFLREFVRLHHTLPLEFVQSDLFKHLLVHFRRCVDLLKTFEQNVASSITSSEDRINAAKISLSSIQSVDDDPLQEVIPTTSKLCDDVITNTFPPVPPPSCVIVSNGFPKQMSASSLLNGESSTGSHKICLVEMLSLLSELCKAAEVRMTIAERLPLQYLLYDIGFHDPMILVASVQLFMRAYVPPRTPCTSITQEYLIKAISRSIELISSRESGAMYQGSITIRRLNRSVNLLQPDLAEISRQGRLVLLDIFDNLHTTDIKDLIVVDALSALCGWRKVYWRSLKSEELRDIINCLEDIRTSGVTDNVADSNSSFDMKDSNDAEIATNSLLQLAEGDATGERISGEMLEYTTNRLMQKADYLNGFVLHWRELSYAELLRKIVYMSSVAHCLGIEALESIVSITTVCDILVEVLLYNRFGVADYCDMQDRCLSLIADITLCKPSALHAKLAVCEHVIAIVSEWTNLSNTSLMLNCIAILVVLAYSDKAGPVGTFIMESVEKLHMITQRIGDILALSPLLFLCRECITSITELEAEGLVVVIGWCVRGLQCEISRTRMRACQIISEVGMLQPRLFHQTFSRREIEEGLISTMARATEPGHAIEAVKALSACVRHLNLRPLWTYDCWVYHWGIRRRFLLEAEMGIVLSNALKHFRGSQKALVLAFSLDFSSAVLTSTLVDKKSELHRILIDDVINQVPATMQMFTNETSDTVSKPISEMDSVATELLAFHTLQLLQAFLCYDMNECLEKLHLYSQTPICCAVPSIMTRFPKNQAIQRFGIDILRIFAMKSVDVENLGEWSPVALMCAVEACPHDGELLRAFCVVSDVLARTGSESVHEKLKSTGVHKSLHDLLKTCSRELAPQVLVAVGHMCNTEQHAEHLIGLGFLDAILRVLERHNDTIRVQVEGLRTLLALLLHAPEQRELLSNVDVKNTLERIHNLLTASLRESSLGADCDVNDVKALLVRVTAYDEKDVTVANCKCVCVIS